MVAAIVFQSVAIRTFRNIGSADIEPSPRLNVIAGDNGQGKTSLLEALYFVATSRSFRTSRLPELVQDGAEVLSVRASISEGGGEREQRAAIANGRRALAVDGKSPARLSSYATRTPVIVFHPGDLELVSGSAAPRRLLLDRLALFLEPSSADDRQRYALALRQRQRALDERGPLARELDAFDALASEHGARLSRARRISAARLTDELGASFARVAPADLRLATRYVPGGTEDAQQFRDELSNRRSLDARRGSATFGPQRDELELLLDGRSARQHGSQGQQRILTLALKLAELSCVRQARSAHPVLLLDDVSSELDAGRTGAVYELVLSAESQVFVTTTRRELLTGSELRRPERADFTLEAGVVRNGAS